MSIKEVTIININTGIHWNSWAYAEIITWINK
jgi:hypothetical protein